MTGKSSYKKELLKTAQRLHRVGLALFGRGDNQKRDFIPSSLVEIARQLGVVDLPVSLAHTWFAGQFEWDYRDPFDRILAAQAAMDNLTLISNNSAFKAINYYDLVW